MLKFDEEDIRERLAPLDRSHRTAFAAACAERLFPLFNRYVQVTGKGNVVTLNAALERAWSAARGDDSGDLLEAQQVAESMVPDDEAEWIFEMGYGQNAAAAVAYALRSWLENDPQDGAWAARQVYEAADYAAQSLLPDLNLNAPGAAQELLEQTAVQTALTGLMADLKTVESLASDSWVDLQERARREGVVWARSLP